MEFYDFPIILGMSSSQLLNSYFSEGWLNHQPDMGLPKIGGSTSNNGSLNGARYDKPECFGLPKVDTCPRIRKSKRTEIVNPNMRFSTFCFYS